MRSLQKAQNLKLGFEPDHLLNVRMDPEWAGYDRAADQGFFTSELERRVTRLARRPIRQPGFQRPHGLLQQFARLVYIDGRPMDPDTQPPAIGSNMVDAPYFDTLKIRILRGRAFADSDDEHAPHVAPSSTRPWRRAIGPTRMRSASASAPDSAMRAVGRWWASPRTENTFRSHENQFPYFYMPLAQNSTVDARAASALPGCAGGVERARGTRNPSAGRRTCRSRICRPCAAP